MKNYVFTLVLCTPYAAFAQSRALPTNVESLLNIAGSAGVVGQATLLDAAPLNGTADSLTVIVRPGQKYAKLEVNVDYTYSAATAVTIVMSCTKIDGQPPVAGSTYFRRTSSSTASGTRTVYLLSETHTTVAASASYTVEYGVRTCDKVKLVFSGASAGAGDLVTVTAQGVVGR